MPASESMINDLLTRARALEQSFKFSDAELLYQQILQLVPNHFLALHQLGVCAYGRGDYPRALHFFHHLQTLHPDHPDLLNSVGLVLRASGDLPGAEASFRRCIALRPDNSPAHNNLGIVLRAQKRFQDAVDAYRYAIRLAPNYASARGNLGNVLRDLGQTQDAVDQFRAALDIDPNFSDAWSNLGAALAELGHNPEAEAALRKAIHLRPDFPFFLQNLADHLSHREQFDEALLLYRHALRIDPHWTHAHLGIAKVQQNIGHIEDCVDILTANLPAAPHHPFLETGRLFALHFHPDFDTPAIAREHRKWAAPVEAANAPLSHSNDRSPDRPLRIGYISSDFRAHVVARNILPLFQHRDRTNFHATCYMLSAQTDDYTQTIRSAVDVLRVHPGNTPHETAAIIQADQIDILVDLALHTVGNGLSVCLLKPAPVQFSFAGYPGSTGLSRIDYRLTDPLLEPPGLFEPFSSETLIPLDGSFWCYEAIARDIPISPLPARSADHITFGCLNHPRKMNRRVFELWAKTLTAVPNSHLILLHPQGSSRADLLKIFASAGIDSSRIHIHAYLPADQYLQLYHSIDIMLDTFPYNGHTTSLDALWMGVPIVTLLGQTPVGRATFSQLTHLGLPELAAKTQNEFVSIASALAADLDRLAALRSTLRTRMQNSLLMDGFRFARSIERAFRHAWHNWCNAPR